MLQKAILAAVMAALIIPAMARVGDNLRGTFGTIAGALNTSGHSVTVAGWNH